MNLSLKIKTKMGINPFRKDLNISFYFNILQLVAYFSPVE